MLDGSQMAQGQDRSLQELLEDFKKNADHNDPEQLKVIESFRRHQSFLSLASLKSTSETKHKVCTCSFWKSSGKKPTDLIRSEVSGMRRPHIGTGMT